MPIEPTSPEADASQIGHQTSQCTAPPDEQFWVRYSPHHEFRLSTLSSILLHVLLYGAAAFLVSTVLLAKDKTGSVQMDVVREPGNGNGEATSQGSSNPVIRQTRTEQGGTAPVQDAAQPMAAHDFRVPQPQLREPKIDFQDTRHVPTSGGDQITRLETITHQLQPQSVGPSTVAEDGPGDGKPGDGIRPGNKPPTPQEQRLLRRVIKYDVGDGNLYRQELAGLGITLATPEKGAKGKTVYRVYRDLNHIPPKGKIEEPDAIRRTFWEDNNPETVRLLARALHIRPPSEFIAFLPPELEEDLLKKELAFKHVTDEKQIKKTVFAVVPIRGGYKVVVESQKLYGK